MRAPIIDTTRTLTVEKDVVEFDGIDREVWLIVERCPVNGVNVWGSDYYASREEANRAINEIFA